MSDVAAQLADLHGHHIEGHVQGFDRIKVDLISHIEGDLWMGGCLPMLTLPADFRWVLSLYDGAEYRRRESTRALYVPRFYDSADIRDDALLHRLADLVLEMLMDGKTLVHCQAGLNRSGLITALALVKQGRTSADAIALLRERRHKAVLCNTVFERWLLGLADRDGGAVGHSPPAGVSPDLAAANGGDAPDDSSSPSGSALSGRGTPLPTLEDS